MLRRKGFSNVAEGEGEEEERERLPRFEGMEKPGSGNQKKEQSFDPNALRLEGIDVVPGMEESRPVREFYGPAMGPPGRRIQEKVEEKMESPFKQEAFERNHNAEISQSIREKDNGKQRNVSAGVQAKKLEREREESPDRREETKRERHGREGRREETRMSHEDDRERGKHKHHRDERKEKRNRGQEREDKSERKAKEERHHHTQRRRSESRDSEKSRRDERKDHKKRKETSRRRSRSRSHHKKHHRRSTSSSSYD